MLSLIKYVQVSCLVSVLMMQAALSQSQQPVFHVIGQVPYAFVDERDEKRGYHLDIANQILQEAGFLPQAKMVPLKRLIRDLSSGGSDCAILANTPLVQERFSAIEALGVYLDAGVILRNKHVLKEYTDLKKYRIGVPAGVSIDKRFDADEKLRKMPTKDYQQSVLMLNRGRIDGIIGALDSIRYSALKNGFNPEKFFSDPLIFKRFTVMLVCRKDSQNEALVLRLQRATKTLRETGVISKIKKDFFN